MSDSPDKSKSAAIGRLRRKLIALDCPLADLRRSSGALPVIGEGSLDARIMLVGEAPGKKEAATGRPFCGASGKFLDILLASVGLDRNSVYITNVVNDRPPENRDPLPEEIEGYAAFLKKQIEIIRPAVIVTLGRISMKWVFGHVGIGSELRPISEIHGRCFAGAIPRGKIPVRVIALYHPAVALYNGSNRQVLLDDVQALRSCE